METIAIILRRVATSLLVFLLIPLAIPLIICLGIYAFVLTIGKTIHRARF